MKVKPEMYSSKSPLTTHILDVSKGKPAANVPLTLCTLSKEGTWQKLSQRYKIN